MRLNEQHRVVVDGGNRDLGETGDLQLVLELVSRPEPSHPVVQLRLNEPPIDPQLINSEPFLEAHLRVVPTEVPRDNDSAVGTIPPPSDPTTTPKRRPGCRLGVDDENTFGLEMLEQFPERLPVAVLVCEQPEDPAATNANAYRRGMFSSCANWQFNPGDTPCRRHFFEQAASMSADASVPSMSMPATASGTRSRPEPHMTSSTGPPAARAYRIQRSSSRTGASGLSRS